MRTLKQLCAAHTKALNTGENTEETLRKELLDFQPKNKKEQQTKLAYFAAFILRQGSDLKETEVQKLMGKPV